MTFEATTPERTRRGAPRRPPAGPGCGSRLHDARALHPHALVEWEERLHGYRFVNLTPWNFVGLSSTFTGVSLRGPVTLGGKRRVTYHVGLFNLGSYHALELSDRKQVQGRLSVFPWGSKTGSDGIGITGFAQRSAANVTPDSGRDRDIDRYALIVHRSGRDWSLAVEHDWGHGAFSTGSLFTACGPPDEFGLGVTPFASIDALGRAILNDTRSRQRGDSVFGHVAVGRTPLDAFFLFQRFQPNTRLSDNPFDLVRSVVGLCYRISDTVRVAVDAQSLRFPAEAYSIPADTLAVFSRDLAAANPSGVSGAALGPTRGLFLNVEFAY